jgi:hypothetical protein
LNVAPTPQSKVQSPLQDDSTVHTETRKKRKSKGIVKNDETTKEHEGEGGSHYSPQREVSTKLAPKSVDAPSNKATRLKGRRLLFSSPSIADKVKARRPFTRSSTKKESTVEKMSLKSPIQRKGKSVPIKDPIEVVDITTH